MQAKRRRSGYNELFKKWSFNRIKLLKEKLNLHKNMEIVIFIYKQNYGELKLLMIFYPEELLARLIHKLFFISQRRKGANNIT